MDNFLEEIFVG